MTRGVEPNRTARVGRGFRAPDVRGIQPEWRKPRGRLRRRHPALRFGHEVSEAIRHRSQLRDREAT
jgi:hypothetical protein